MWREERSAAPKHTNKQTVGSRSQNAGQRFFLGFVTKRFLSRREQSFLVFHQGGKVWVNISHDENKCTGVMQVSDD